MAEASLPPNTDRRISDIETALANLTRQQNPVKPSILELNDVAGVPTTDRQVLTYNRATGQWSAGTTYFSAGELVFSASATGPPGTLICGGASVLRTDYPDLFTAIGTTYGSVDGTHFTLPNFTDRFPVGAGGAKALGATGGSNDAIVVSHTHAIATSFSGTVTHSHSGNGGVAESESAGNGASSPKPNTDSAGSSGTNANLPPWLACFVYIRT